MVSMAENIYTAYLRFLCNLPAFLKRRVSVLQARQEIEKRLHCREDNFLSLIKLNIYRNSRSPYLPLLKAAACTYGDLEHEVKDKGLEAVLQQLQREGVWISLEEFKGRQPIHRGHVELPVSPDDFDRPHQTAGLRVTSGGTSGRSTGMKLDLQFAAARTAYDSVMLHMLGVHDAPIILWYPILPASTGIGNNLRYIKAGHPPTHWFNMVTYGQSRFNCETRLATNGIVWVSRLAGHAIPRPEDAPLDEVGRIADQIAKLLKNKRRCVFQSYVSQALRISKAVQERTGNMRGLTLIVGSEPLTKAKRREIASTGANLYPRYFATEFGSIGMGCGNPETIDDIHLMSDMLAMIQPSSVESGQAGPLFFTSLTPVMPKILLNVQIGDMAVVNTKSCGCDFGKLGFATHLSRIRSYARVTSQGMAIPQAMLEEIVDEQLTMKHGGTSLDYQWVEKEDACGRTSLQLKISPDVGPIDEKCIIQDILDGVRKKGKGEYMMAEIWSRSDAISICRETPQTTRRGKINPVLRERDQK